MAAKIADKSCFVHNFQIKPRGKGDFSKPVDHVCVWQGYLSENREYESWANYSGGKGHQITFQVMGNGCLIAVVV